MKKYKYITIRQDADEHFKGKAVYRIYSNRPMAQIGILSYYIPWKEYVFSSNENCVFNDGCLKDVLDFLSLIKSNTVPK